MIGALENTLNDKVHPGGGYWPIRLEALAMLGKHRVREYRRRMQEHLAKGVDEALVENYRDK